MSGKMLADIRSLIDGMKGHNYALPDCIKYLFERTGDFEQLDFWNLAALTGDTVAQVYNHNQTTFCEYCVSGFLGGPEYISGVFDMLGYAHEYVTAAQLSGRTAFYTRKITEYIDRGIPVLVKTNIKDIPAWDSDVGTYCLIVGYENDGSIVKLLVCDKTTIDCEIDDNSKLDLIFIGSKQRDVSLEEIYLQTIRKMPYWLTLPERDGMYFGAGAYRIWAGDIEAGRFSDDSIDLWGNYGVYMCNLATNGGELTYIFGKLAQLDPAFSELAVCGERVQKLLPAETPAGGRSRLWIQLEELGGGLDMSAVKLTMTDREKRAKLAAALRDYAERLDQAVTVIEEYINLL